MAEHCRQLDFRFYGLRLKEFRSLAYEFASKNGIETPFKNGLAGYEWAKSFLRRHNLSLRVPQKTSIARAMGFNRTQVNAFYDLLAEMLAKYSFPPSRIFNMDESGISTVPNKIPRVVSSKGKRCVGKAVAAERGETITVVIAFSASGNYVPPGIIFPRKRMKDSLMYGTPSESLGMVSDSGFMTNDLFTIWLKHFQKHVGATKENPVLLILDNHSSHICLATVTYCRDNNIHLLSIPPHCSHKIQPLDKSFFRGLKEQYARAYDDWTMEPANAGRCVRQDQVGRIFGKVYELTATMGKARTGFKTCGIVPFNRDIFEEEDFLPSSVTDQQSICDMIETTPTEMLGTNMNGPTEDKNNDSSETISENQNLIENAEIYFEADGTVIKPCCSKQLSPSRTPPPRTVEVTLIANSSEESFNETTTSTRNSSVIYVPSDIIPLPKIQEERKRRKGKKATILTSSPYKDSLEEKEQEKQKKKDAAVERAKRKINDNSTVVRKNTVKTRKKSTENRDYFCGGCTEKYEEPIIEDWICCIRCERWWHEKCTGYEKGEFVCDLCS